MFQECVSNVADSLHIFWGYWEYAAKYELPYHDEKVSFENNGGYSDIMDCQFAKDDQFVDIEK